jgi:hypothetical protein
LAEGCGEAWKVFFSRAPGRVRWRLDFAPGGRNAR